METVFPPGPDQPRNSKVGWRRQPNHRDLSAFFECDLSLAFSGFSARAPICQSQNARGCKTWWEILAVMCLGTANSSKQRILGTKRDLTCFFGYGCIHGLRCWGVHTSSELELFRQRDALAQSVAQCSPCGGFPAVVSVCRDALFSEARRWCDSEVLAGSRNEFFDAELIPRRRAHRRLRKPQRATHRSSRDRGRGGLS